MNKQELIEKYKEKYPVVTMDIAMLNYFKELWKDIKNLDEPQKVQVPQFVANWYEENKDDFETKLFNTIDLLLRDFEDDELSEFEKWIIDGETKPFQTLVNMHQFGYEVEKEKRYMVKMKGVTLAFSYLKRDAKGYWWFGCDFTSESQRHTRKELEEAGFGEVFNSPLFDVEEVAE